MARTQLQGRLKVARAVSAVVTLVAVGALSLVAAEQGGTLTRYTTVLRHEVASAAPAPHQAGPSAPASTIAPPAALVTPIDPHATASAPVASAASATAPTTPPVTLPAVSPSTPVPASSAPTPSPVANVLPACPLPLPAPAVQGGLQTLIPFAPLFGPFSAEAFASAATFQPILELFGPFLVAFAQQYVTAQPEVTPLLNQVETLENDGYALIAPFYAPYRTQFLTAETNLATALAPIASSLADNPASACVVDLEGVLTAAH